LDISRQSRVGVPRATGPGIGVRSSGRLVVPSIVEVNPLLRTGSPAPDERGNSAKFVVFCI